MRYEGRYRRTVVVGIVINVAIALGVGSIPLLDRGPSLDSDWLRGLALIGILLIPPFLAAIGLRWPVALLSAGVVSIPMCLMSFSFLLLPLLIPATLYLVAYGDAQVTYKAKVPAPLVAVVTIVLAFTAFFSLFAHEDPYCYETVRRADGSTFERRTPSRIRVSRSSMSVSYSSSAHSGGNRVVSSGCSSDSVTGTEAATSLGLVTLAGAGAAFLSTPRSKPS